MSIIPTPSKILEEILREQLSDYMEKKGILPKTQFGFRAGLSTTMAASATNHDWIKAKTEKQSCASLQFDLSSAFDMIDVDLLISKLQIYGLNKLALDVIRSYLSGRSQRVDYDGAQSGVVFILIGSPQGSGLSPLLFLILVSDLEEWVTEGILITYADDTSGYVVKSSNAEVRVALETMAMEVLIFMEATKLKANPNKTSFIMFGSTNELPLCVGNAMVPESSQIELLGIHFNKRLNWKSHLEHTEKELKQRIGTLRNLSQQLPRRVVIQLVEPVFTSKLRYALELVVDTESMGDLVLKRLSSLHRQAMRVALGIGNRSQAPESELLQRTNQMPISKMALIATAMTAWKCLRTWKVHPLTSGRIDEHYNERTTRQNQRIFPPQKIKESIISRLVEVYERLPQEVREEDNVITVKKRIKTWALEI